MMILYLHCFLFLTDILCQYVLAYQISLNVCFFQDPQNAKARLVILRAMEALKQGSMTADDNDKKRKRLDGGGRKPKVPEIRIAMFQWFIDVRTALKGRISLKFFQWTSKQLHQAHLEYKEQQGENITQE